MPTSETYQTAKSRGARLRTRALSVLFAAALALAGALGALALTESAHASVAAGTLGLNVNVPSTVDGMTSDGMGGGSAGAGSLVGVNVRVPDPAGPSGAGGNTEAKVSGAGSLLGVNVEVPDTVAGAEDDPAGAAASGATGLLGVNVRVPSPVPDEDPDTVGGNTEAKVSGSTGLLGVNIEVPSTAQQTEGGSGGSEALLGVSVKVPEGLFVTFLANGGDGTQMIQMTSKEIRPDLSRFSWPGREIVGWYADAECTEFVMGAGDADFVPEEYLKAGARFYAKWRVKTPQETAGVKLHLVDAENAVSVKDAGDYGIQPAGYAEADCADHGSTLYAGEYYPGGDGTVWPLPADASEADKAREGATLELPVPTMEDKVDEGGKVLRSGRFAGWYKTMTETTDAAGNVTRSYSDPVEEREGRYFIPKFAEEDQTYYAKWEVGVFHKFTFEVEEGAFEDGSKTKTFLVADGEHASASLAGVPVREGHSFRAWQHESAAGDRSDYAFGSVVVRADTTVYASWTADTYTVAFDSRGGSAVSSRTVSYNDPVAEPTAPTRSGYDFKGWFTDEACTRAYDFAAPVTSSFTLYAGWEAWVTRTVTFDVNGGVWTDAAMAETVTVADGEPAPEPSAPTRAGYAFDGWCEKTGSDVSVTPWDFAHPVTSDLVLVATWTQSAAGTSTVAFEAGEGKWDADSQGAPGGAVSDDRRTLVLEVANGVPFAEPDAPKRPGWQFAGWHEAAAGGAPEGWDAEGASAVPLGGKWDFGKDTVSADTTLYAKWDLRLDVTVPVSVGFAVDADTREVTTPDMGKYALKSRTVRPVSVDEMAVTSREAELGGFFELADGAGWGDALAGTRLSMVSPASAGPVSLELAKASAGAPAAGAWENSRVIAESEKAGFAIGAFSYTDAGESFDEAWQGGDPSERLDLELGMELSDKLRVKTALDGPKPITHLKLTVSARG